MNEWGWTFVTFSRCNSPIDSSENLNVVKNINTIFYFNVGMHLGIPPALKGGRKLDGKHTLKLNESVLNVAPQDHFFPFNHDQSKLFFRKIKIFFSYTVTTVEVITF